MKPKFMISNFGFDKFHCDRGESHSLNEIKEDIEIHHLKEEPWSARIEGCQIDDSDKLGWRFISQINLDCFTDLNCVVGITYAHRNKRDDFGKKIFEIGFG